MEPSEIRRLRQIARQRRTTVGRLIRDAVRTTYFLAGAGERARAVEEIAAMDIGPLPDWKELKEDLDARHDDLP